MRPWSVFWLLLTLAGLMTAPTHALSRRIGRDVEFPKGYPADKAKAILSVVQNERYEFVDGIVSYWPPDWATRLSFTGDAESLSAFLADLRELAGIGLRVMLYEGREDEGRQDSPWQLEFSHARPDQVTVYLNLKSEKVEWQKLKLPEWERELRSRQEIAVATSEGRGAERAVLRCGRRIPR